jgi:hypothetical protein
MLVNNGSSINENDHQVQRKNSGSMAGTKISIKVNSQAFTATLSDNPSAKAFEQILPMTVQMVELNGNEKFSDLPISLPTNPSNPQTIKNGDLMLYGSKTFVLFYKTFSTSYSYTKIGEIDHSENLQKALGSGNVTVIIEKQ